MPGRDRTAPSPSRVKRAACEPQVRGLMNARELRSRAGEGWAEDGLFPVAAVANRRACQAFNGGGHRERRIRIVRGSTTILSPTLSLKERGNSVVALRRVLLSK